MENCPFLLIKNSNSYIQIVPCLLNIFITYDDYKWYTYAINSWYYNPYEINWKRNTMLNLIAFPAWWLWHKKIFLSTNPHSPLWIKNNTGKPIPTSHSQHHTLCPVLLTRHGADACVLANGRAAFIWKLCCHWLKVRVSICMSKTGPSLALLSS